MNPKGYAKMAKTMQTFMLELHPEFKFIPRTDNSSLTEEDRLQLENIETNVRTFLQGIKQTNSYENVDTVEDKKGK